MNLETDFKLPKDGTVIRYGVVLVSRNTHDVLVMYNEKENKPIVKVMHDMSRGKVKDVTWFELERFITSWGTAIEISHNINIFN